jgi:hypothetical protein
MIGGGEIFIGGATPRVRRRGGCDGHAPATKMLERGGYDEAAVVRRSRACRITRTIRRCARPAIFLLKRERNDN